MGFEILYERKANAMLRRLPTNTRKRLVSKIEQLAHNPDALNQNVKKLQGRRYKEIYRLRVADWRIFYRIQRQQIQIVVIDICSRGDAYNH